MVDYPNDPLGELQATKLAYHRALLFSRCRPAENGCWVWIGYGDDRNRPKIKLDRRMLVAARVSYELFVGPITGRMMVCHSCDNPMCVNPAHLWLGTALENTRDMIAKGRSQFSYFRMNGMANPRAVLDVKRVAQIKRSLLDGEKQVTIAKRHKVSISTISAIANEERWVEVEPAAAVSLVASAPNRA